MNTRPIALTLASLALVPLVGCSPGAALLALMPALSPQVEVEEPASEGQP